MTQNERAALHLLSDLLAQIRGIAGDATEVGHVSLLGRGQFNPETACQAIYDLADAAQNIPLSLADGLNNGSGFLLNSSIEKLARIGVHVFGHRSPF